MNSELRPAVDADLAAIGNVLVASYEEFGRAIGPEWDRMRSDLVRVPVSLGAKRWVVADRGAALHGVIAYFPPGDSDPSLFESSWASIRLLGVVPEARRTGLARRLTLACLDLARAQGARHVGLHTSELMTAAQALYEGLGFRRDREIARRYGVRYWVYVLELEPAGASAG